MNVVNLFVLVGQFRIEVRWENSIARLYLSAAPLTLKTAILGPIVNDKGESRPTVRYFCSTKSRSPMSLHTPKRFSPTVFGDVLNILLSTSERI